MSDSSTSGFLAPANPPPDYDADLEDLFQAFAVGVTGLQGSMVRPKWQMNPGNMPDSSQNWISYGLLLQERQWDAYVSHDGTAAAGQGESTVSGSETWHCTYSFYGPNCQLYLSILRDAMSIGQNRDVFGAKKIKFIEFMEPVSLPVLLKDTWNRRVDLKGVFHRWVERTYSVRNLASADPSSMLDNEHYITPISVPHP